jgi:hypothetical protein
MSAEYPIFHFDVPSTILCDGRTLEAGRHAFVLAIDYERALAINTPTNPEFIKPVDQAVTE